MVFMPTNRPPCGMYQRQLVACRNLMNRYASARLKAVLITDVAPGALHEAAGRYNVWMPVFSDEAGRTAKMFHTREGFELYVIDRTGEVAFHQYPPVPDHDAPLTRYLDLITSTAHARKESLQ